MNQVYDFKRIMLLARFKFGYHKKILLLSVMGYFALLFIIGFFIAYGNRNHVDTRPFYTIFHYIGLPVMMVVGSVLLAGRSFQEMNTPEKSTIQILLPASSFEKYIVHLFSTSILWMLFSFVSYHIFSLIFNGAWTAFYGYEFELFNGLKIFNVYMIAEIILGYFLLHSIFLLGAAAFKKYPMVKTVLAQFILNWAYSILGFLVIIILFGSTENFGLKMDQIDNILLEKGWFTLENIEYIARLILKTATVLLAAAFYVTGYYKLKEREV